MNKTIHAEYLNLYFPEYFAFICYHLILDHFSFFPPILLSETQGSVRTLKISSELVLARLLRCCQSISDSRVYVDTI